MFIDLHAHLDLVKDIDRAVEEAKKAGVSIIVSSGIHPKSNRIALEVEEKHDIVRASVGLYPIDALKTEISPEKYSVDIDEEIEFIRQNRDRIIAIGEIGLDFKTGKDKDEQEGLFRRMLDLASELDKPVVIHSRKAEADALKILKGYSLKIILHCFSGKKRLVEKAIKRGYMFTVPTIVVKSEQFQHLAGVVPLNQLFCETDSPFMSPYEGRKNEPAFVVESYKKIAEAKGLDMSEVRNIIYSNWQRTFL